MIIRRYLYREVLVSFAAVLSVLLVVYMSNRFVRYLAQAVAGEVPSEVILRLLMIKMVANLGLLLPLALFVAILLALGRLHRDSEVVAMQAGGMGTARIAGSIFWLSLGFALVSAVLALYVAPKLTALQEDILGHARGEVQVSGILPGRFQEFGGGTQSVYAGRVAPDHQTLYDVFVQVRRHDTQDVLTAKRAYITAGPQGGRYLVLEDGHRYSGVPGRPDYVVTRYVRHAVLLADAATGSGYRKLETYGTLALWRKGGLPEVAEIEWRVSLPIALVILAVLAVPLAQSSPREGRYAKMFSAILVYFIYYNAISVAQKLIEHGELPTYVGVWVVHAVMATATIVLLVRQSGGHRLLKTAWRRLAAAG